MTLSTADSSSPRSDLCAMDAAVTAAAADHACGRHAAGYGVGCAAHLDRSLPSAAPGTRNANPSAAASSPSTTESASSCSPARAMPRSAIAESWVQTAAAVVAERPVPGGLRRHRADAEAGRHRGSDQKRGDVPPPRRDRGCRCRAGDRCCSSAYPRGACRASSAIAGVAALRRLDPVRLPRSGPRSRRSPGPQLVAARFAEAHRAGPLPRAPPRRRSPAPRTARSVPRRAAVAPLDRVAGVLPSLVRQPVTGLVDVVDEAVAVAVAVVSQPGQRAAQWRAAGRRTSSSRHPGVERVGEQAHPERSRVDRAVVERRQQRRPRRASRAARCAARAGSCRAAARSRRRPLALESRQDAKGGCRDPGVHGQREPRRPQRVASEQREEPRRAGGEELVVRVVGQRQPERVEVAERGIQPPAEPRVARRGVQRDDPRRGSHGALHHERRVVAASSDHDTLVGLAGRDAHVPVEADAPRRPCGRAPGAEIVNDRSPEVTVNSPPVAPRRPGRSQARGVARPALTSCSGANSGTSSTRRSTGHRVRDVRGDASWSRRRARLRPRGCAAAAPSGRATDRRPRAAGRRRSTWEALSRRHRDPLRSQARRSPASLRGCAGRRRDRRRRSARAPMSPDAADHTCVGARSTITASFSSGCSACTTVRRVHVIP